MLGLGLSIILRAAGYITGMLPQGNGGGSLQMENAGYILKEDGFKILLE